MEIQACRKASFSTQKCGEAFCNSQYDSGKSNRGTFMLDHLELAVADLSHAVRFYKAALAPLGYGLRVTSTLQGFGVDMNSLDFWLREGSVSTPRPHFAFRCSSREFVDIAHRAALGAGGRNNGSPRLLTRIHPHYYAGFVFDPDGHNVEFVCHKEENP
jgi:catechol 2,3-dioxygenase-like lactoylglutathione lyase family enzyme